MRLERHPASPLLYPNPLHEWEAINVFNAAVTVHNGLYHMHYRAQGNDYISRIGYAVSADGCTGTGWQSRCSPLTRAVTTTGAWKTRA